MTKNNKTKQQVRVFKTPLIIPVSILMVIVLYIGYGVYYALSEEAAIFAQLKASSFEVFLLCEIGMISIIVYNKIQLSTFLDKHTTIDNMLVLEKLKPIARTNMYSTLLVFVFLGLGSLTAVMSFIHHGIKVGVVVALLTAATTKVMAWYTPFEEKLKQIRTTDELLEEELDSIIHCWMQKLMPDF